MNVIYDKESTIKRINKCGDYIYKLKRNRSIVYCLNLITLLLIIADPIYCLIADQTFTQASFLMKIVLIFSVVVSTLTAKNSVPETPSFATPNIWYHMATNEPEFSNAVVKAEATDTGYAVSLSFEYKGKTTEIDFGEMSVELCENVSEKTVDLEREVILLPTTPNIKACEQTKKGDEMIISETEQ